MKRVWKITDAAAQAELFCFTKPKTLASSSSSSPFNFTLTKSPNYAFATRDLNPHHSSKYTFPTNILSLFADKLAPSDSSAKEDLRNKVTRLKEELVLRFEDSEDYVFRVLEEKGASLFRSYSDGSAFIELLKQLSSWPHLALEVFFPFLHV